MLARRQTRAALAAEVSRDGGRTWSPSVRIAAQVGGGVNGMRTGGLPSATIDPVSGQMYVVWQDSRYRSNGTPDILLSQSATAANWTAPRRVNSDALNNGVAHFTPDVAAYAGRVYVSYRTRTGTSRFVGYRLASSIDGARIFDAGRALGPPADLRYAAVAPVAFLGDYMGLAATRTGSSPTGPLSSRPTAGAGSHQTLWAAALAVGRP